jgi:hypothetical protein
VIAENGHGALGDVARDFIDHIARIGAISDHVAEKDETFGPLALRMRHTGVERLLVGVDVGQNRDEHGDGVSSAARLMRARSCPL